MSLPNQTRIFAAAINANWQHNTRTLPLEWTTSISICRGARKGSAPGEFDLVYAVNVMHISKNLLFSLNEARSALVADGWLVIGECVRPYDNQPMYPELMFQILDSFTNVETDPEIRPNPGFLTAEQWRRAFLRAGFAQDGNCAGYRANPRDLPAFFHRRHLRTKQTIPTQWIS